MGKQTKRRHCNDHMATATFTAFTTVSRPQVSLCALTSQGKVKCPWQDWNPDRRGGIDSKSLGHGLPYSMLYFRPKSKY